jgi:hypothetical protein
MIRIKAFLNSAIVLYFVICFEILIMISPFAGFFYSAFNPVLLGFAKYPATKWISSFFFTHMVVPPTGPLKVVRVMGSVLFLLGISVFFICAIQVLFAQVSKERGCSERAVPLDKTSSIPRSQHCRCWPGHPLAEVHRGCFVARDDIGLLHFVQRRITADAGTASGNL